MRRHRLKLTALAIGAVPGAAMAAVTMYAAWQHNPMGEFHEDGRVHWGAWLEVGLPWLVVAGAPCALLAYAVLRGLREEG